MNPLIKKIKMIDPNPKENHSEPNGDYDVAAAFIVILFVLIILCLYAL